MLAKHKEVLYNDLTFNEEATQMTTWILALALFSNPNGQYVKEFSSEKQCVAEMKKIIKSNDDNIKAIGCINSKLLG